ncbi:hypothetical protein [Enterovibrio calviensis]|uniref:hypothetical protein n=1 Tax=Enterovibrio calviensis TaxID=91359 RepID=UPI0004849541|nr:hypothetical protein [Enterovibrio calviensis]
MGALLQNSSTSSLIDEEAIKRVADAGRMPENTMSSASTLLGDKSSTTTNPPISGMLGGSSVGGANGLSNIVPEGSPLWHLVQFAKGVGG